MYQSGDYLGINWGYMYVATGNDSDVMSVMGPALDSRSKFVDSGFGLFSSFVTLQYFTNS